ALGYACRRISVRVADVTPQVVHTGALLARELVVGTVETELEAVFFRYPKSEALVVDAPERSRTVTLLVVQQVVQLNSHDRFELPSDVPLILWFRAWRERHF